MPRVLRKKDPTYSKEAERERIQGTALYALVVDRSGRARDIELISPIGYGLDEKGLEAIGQWVFAPAMKDGSPVSVRAQIEVNFRFPGIAFDAKAEEQRTSYNSAIHGLQISDRKSRAVETIGKLAAQKYPPAMALLGQWMLKGEEVPRDRTQGLDLIRKAAEKYERSALFTLGMLSVKGDGVPVDLDEGFRLLRDASMYGSAAAQFYLGSKYEIGDGLPADSERAKYYFRLCAARGVGPCQFHLGKLLISVPGEKKGDLVQAAAWLELASGNAVKEAEPLAKSLGERLSAEELRMVAKLKPQLLRP
jgi:TonB family protein